jgi:two-component system phosphate regulon sensor histidine kinase PhoR
LQPLLVQASRAHEHAATQRDIRCHVEGDDAPVYVLGDREALVQIIDNLLDNAIKYTGSGGVVRLSAQVEQDEVVLAVSDTGLGIPADEQERIFERFYRVDKARSRAVGGTGLGLSIVKHLVAAMAGEISVESVEGTGTTMRVRLARSSILARPAVVE